MITFLRPIASKLLHITFPGLYWKRKVKYYQSHFSEKEMYLLPLLCDPTKTSLDIGGAIGVYTANLYDKSNNVITFEPIPSNVKLIGNMIRHTRMNASVLAYAISDHSGEETLKMVDGDTGLSTLEKSNDLTASSKQVNSIDVETRKLDDFKFDTLGFIKIDVEGHEAAVLRGASSTISTCLPNLLVEIEERHKKGAVLECVNYLSNFGYDCFFLLDKKLLPFAEFNLQLHQNPSNIGTTEDNFKRKGIYINNFIFINSKVSANFLENAKNILSQL